MSATALARPSDGTPTRSMRVLAVTLRREVIVRTPGPSPQEVADLLRLSRWGIDVSVFRSCFGDWERPALPAPEHIAASPITEIAVSVPLRDLGVPVMEERPVARPSTEWGVWRRRVHRWRLRLWRSDWSVRAGALVGAGALALLAAETHPWRFAGALLAMATQSMWGVFVGCILVGSVAGVLTFWAPRRAA